MAKYVSYDEVSNRLKSFIDKDRIRKIRHSWSTNQVLEMLNYAAKNKTISIEITKCKDCKHFSQKPDYCHKLCVDVDEDFWCKYAEDSN